MHKRCPACLGLALVGAALLLAAVPATASTFLAVSPQQLVRQADAIVQGKVIQLDSFWSESGRLIVTEAIVAVEEVLVGQAPSTVAVRTAGGQVGDILVEAHGFPKFADGERVLLFLAFDAETGTHRVLGYQQGHFRIVTRLDGVTLAVPMVEGGARYLTASGELAPEPKSVELGSFKAAIRTFAERSERIQQK